MERAIITAADNAMPRAGQRTVRHLGRAAAVVAVAALLALGLAGCGGSSSGSPGPSATPSRPRASQTAIDATLDAAERLIQSGNLADAEIVAARLCERGGGVAALELHGRVLAGLAAQAETSGDRDRASALRQRALARYNEAIDAGPASAGLFAAAGMLADACGDPSTAADRYATAAERDPRNPQYPLFEAQARMRLGDRAAARGCLDRVLAISPDEPFALATLAELAAADGDRSRAFALIGQARRAAPEIVALRVVEARLRREADQARLAAELLLALPDAERNDPVVVRELAASFDAMGEPARAAEAWEACYRAARGRGAAAAEAGLAWIRAGDRDRAAGWLRVAELEAPDSPVTSRLQDAIRRVPQDLVD